MSSAPITILLVATATLAFQAMIFGTSLVENSLLPTIEMRDCQADLGPLETIGCVLRNVGAAIANFFIMLTSVALFFWNALTFNIDGAPILVRVFVGTIAFGSVGWAIASLFRGTKA